jgi:hypothetical protein
MNCFNFRNISLLLFCSLIGLNTIAQSSYEDSISSGYADFRQKDKYYVYEKGCDTGGQQDVNRCLSIASTRLSELVNFKYNCIISYLENKIREYSISKKDSEIAGPYKREKESLVLSEVTWNTLVKQNLLYYKGAGGTMTPMLESLSLIDDCKDRLRTLDEIEGDLGQGEDGFKECK